MIDATGFFVQFPHPRHEHAPPGPHMNWNVGRHSRKFLTSPGRSVDGAGTVAESELVFWAEWEPPSEIIEHWPRSGALPRALHRPYWFRPTTNGYRQNTDPWVFGDQMLYSNCRQGTSWLRALTRGSVICFGSRIDSEFCLDTVFVVASSESWTPAATEGLDEAFVVCTAESLLTSQHHQQARVGAAVRPHRTGPTPPSRCTAAQRSMTLSTACSASCQP